MNFNTDYFRSIGVKPLYDCQRFHCGDSNLWANNVFDIPTLYGLDKEQAYFIGIKEESGKQIYYSVYTVRRGNHRSYVLVDIFESDKKVEKESVEMGKLSYVQLRKAGTFYLSADDPSNAIEKLKIILSNHINEEKEASILIFMTTRPVSSIQAFDENEALAEQKSDTAEKAVNSHRPERVTIQINLYRHRPRPVRRLSAKSCAVRDKTLNRNFGPFSALPDADKGQGCQKPLSGLHKPNG